MIKFFSNHKKNFHQIGGQMDDKDKSVGGFSLVEILIVVSITVILLLVLSLFQRNLFFLRSVLQGQFDDQFNARKLVGGIIAEIRTISPAESGAYPIETASDSTLSFFTDLDSDGTKERIRYTLEGSDLVRGVTLPVGDNPPVYLDTNEATTTFMTSVVNLSLEPVEPLFEYFDETYAGTSSPISSPVPVSDVRLIKVKVFLDSQPNRDPEPLEVESQSTIRNLRGSI